MLQYVAGGSISAIAQSSNGNYFYVAFGNQIDKVHLPTGRNVGKVNTYQTVTSIIENTSNQYLVVGLTDGAVQTYNRLNSNLGNSIYWEGPNSGPLPRLMVIWNIQNGAVVLPSIVIDVAPADWQVRTVGDITGSGPSDLIWQNTNPGFSIPGLIAYWGVEPNGTPFPAGTGGAPPSFDWQIRGFSDMNGNGIPDFTWLNVVTGQIAIWFRDSSGTVTSTTLVGIRPPGWRLAVASQSFIFGGGQIWFQNSSTGAVTYWQLAPSGAVEGSISVGNPGLQWELSGAGTFSNNAFGLLFRNTSSNQLAYWNVAWPGDVLSTGTLGSAPTGWKIIGVGNLD